MTQPQGREDEDGRDYLWPEGTTLGDLARAVDAVVIALREERDRLLTPIVDWLARKLP